MPHHSTYDPERHGPRRIVGPGFHEQVYARVRTVPAGRVTTYGDVARALGSASVARHVGFALAALGEGRDDVPWFRVVNGRGRVHTDPDAPDGGEQRRQLRAEGVEVDAEGRIAEFGALRFLPPPAEE